MGNEEVRRGIAFEMRDVPRVGNSWRYVPIKDMPPTTEIWFNTTNTATPGELQPRQPPVCEEDSELVFRPETPEQDVLRLPEGRYGLRIGETSATTLIYPDGSEELVKPLYDRLAPSSCFQANVDRPKSKREHLDDTWSITYRLTTGVIDAIFILGTRFNLALTDAEKESSKLKLYKDGGRPTRHKV